jgi:hypothetical protein
MMQDYPKVLGPEAKVGFTRYTPIQYCYRCDYVPFTAVTIVTTAEPPATSSAAFAQAVSVAVAAVVNTTAASSAKLFL